MTLYTEKGEIKFMPGSVIEVSNALLNCIRGIIPIEEIAEEEVKVTSEPTPIVKGQTNEKSKKSRK